MTTNRPAPQVKYELLEKNRRSSITNSQTWTVFCLIILIICISIITLFTTWKKVNFTENDDEMDFIMFGPRKVGYSGYDRILSNRAKIYSMANFQAKSNSSWGDIDINVTTSNVMEVSDFKIVCYYSIPVNGSSIEQLWPSMLDPYLCTHINIAFATITNMTIQPSRPTDGQIYTEVVNLKQVNPSLKVLLSVEWFTSEGEMALVVSCKRNRKMFIEEAVKLLTAYSLDGLDIDWEFPSWPNNDINQRSNFTLLLKEFREYLDRMSVKQKPILTVAVAAPAPIINQAYDINEMKRYIDYINLMAYDFHSYTSYLPVTGPNAPLFEIDSEKGYFTTLNTNWSALYWMGKGMPAEKIVVGFPTYGHSFTLFNECNNGWYAPASGIGSLGVDGFVSYADVCKFITLEDSVIVFDGKNKVPFTYRKKEWISFDNEQSIAYKAEYAKWKGFGGVMLFSLNTDDFSAVCDGKTTFPLARRVKIVIEDDSL
uniref:GH18 domain-containing protein n=2 Tax=Clastoptera arizonana TaxID=38151 RepID=A0A1B6DPY5_9HEMI